MPSRTKSNGAAASKAAPSATKKFELPALTFEFGSLTDGTDIPPPQPSPRQEVPTPPKTPEVEAEKKKDETKKTEGAAANVNGLAPVAETSPKSTVTSSTNGVKRPAESTPASPTLSQKGSLRRFMSRTLLNNTHDDQASTAARPPSRIASISGEDRRSKRSSGWFKRLTMHEHHNGNKRSSMMFDEVKPTKPAGPPPPMIPEMSAWDSKVDVTLGDDIFKDIH